MPLKSQVTSHPGFPVLPLWRWQMGKQTMGFPLHSFPFRFDNKLYRLQVWRCSVLFSVTCSWYILQQRWLIGRIGVFFPFLFSFFFLFFRISQALKYRGKLNPAANLEQQAHH